MFALCTPIVVAEEDDQPQQQEQRQEQQDSQQNQNYQENKAQKAVNDSSHLDAWHAVDHLNNAVDPNKDEKGQEKK
jgi:hypothetical protein